MTWKEFFQHNFDKILLIVVLHGIMVLVVTTMHDAPILADWLKGEASTVMGALIMLITGRASRPDPAITESTTTTKSVTVAPPPEAPPT